MHIHFIKYSYFILFLTNLLRSCSISASKRLRRLSTLHRILYGMFAPLSAVNPRQLYRCIIFSNCRRCVCPPICIVDSGNDNKTCLLLPQFTPHLLNRLQGVTTRWRFILFHLCHRQKYNLDPFLVLELIHLYLLQIILKFSLIISFIISNRKISPNCSSTTDVSALGFLLLC